MIKILAISLTWALVACSTVHESAPVMTQPKASMPSSYMLNEGQKIENNKPLPDMTKLMVNWTYSDGEKKEQEGFRGWDFDHDGRFEMLEVLDTQGKPYMWAYDFDGDGVVDAVDKEKDSRSEGDDRPNSRK